VIPTPVYIRSLATALPEFKSQQSEIEAFMLRVVAKTDRQKSFVRKIYEGSSIDTRYSVLPDYRLPTEERTYFPKNDDLDPVPTTAERNALFCVEANNLAELAVRRLFDQMPGFDPRSVTHLITVSCTGFSAPGFDFHLVREFALSPSIHRFHIGFMGCFAAFPALKLAQSLVRSTPGAQVLIVDVEACTLHFQKDFEPDVVVANALFADGAAALLVSEQPGPLQLHDFRSHIIPGSEDDMAWIIGETGFDMKLSSYVPRLIEGNIGAVLERLFADSGWGREELKLWAVHPGGRAILDKTAAVLGLNDGQLDVSYDVLRRFGNMSSVTIFFVLKEILERGRKGKLFACAFGPGLTVESGFLEAM
jgi:predicted naringenin-chalcone synthase